MNMQKHKSIFFGISLFFLIPSLYFLLVYGLQPSIDFVGGSVLEISLQSVEDVSAVTVALSETYPESTTVYGGNGIFTIDLPVITNEVKAEGLKALSERFGTITERRFETIGPSLSRELLHKTLAALLIVATVITAYIWRQFSDLKFGVCATIAMLHDSIILLGAFSFFGYLWGIKVDVLFVTALLTTLSFSVHDTIVVYDRIRELRRKNRGVDFGEIVSTSVLETLVRSLNNSVTIIMMLSALALLGGETIRWFAVALLIGAVTGTYSSTFTAAPLLLLWDEVVAKRKK